MSSSESESPVKTPKKDKKHKKEKRSKDEPKSSKKRAREDDSSPDEGVIDPVPVKKVSKFAKVKNADGEEMTEIGNMRYVTVREFRGRSYVDIREFYTDKASGQLKPGKKGVSLTKEQFDNLKSLIPEIDEKLR